MRIANENAITSVCQASLTKAFQWAHYSLGLYALQSTLCTDVYIIRYHWEKSSIFGRSKWIVYKMESYQVNSLPNRETRHATNKRGATAPKGFILSPQNGEIESYSVHLYWVNVLLNKRHTRFLSNRPHICVLQFAIHNNKRKSTCSKIHSYALHNEQIISFFFFYLLFFGLIVISLFFRLLQWYRHTSEYSQFGSSYFTFLFAFSYSVAIATFLSLCLSLSFALARLTVDFHSILF